MKNDSLFSHKTIFSMVMMIVLFFVSSMAFGNHNYAEEDKKLADENTRIVLSDTEGNSVDMSLEEYKELFKTEITSKGTIKEIEKSVEAYRKRQTLIGPRLLSERSTYNWVFGDWSNWQDDGQITNWRVSSSSMPTSIGTNRWDLKQTLKASVERIGDTHPVLITGGDGIIVDNASNPTSSVITSTSGDTSHVYDDSFRRNKSDLTGTRPVVIDRSDIYIPSTGGINNVLNLFQYINNDKSTISYIPDTAGSVSVNTWVQYNSTDKLGYKNYGSDNKPIINYIYSVNLVIPQIVKSVHKELGNNNDLGHEGSAGKDRYYGDNISLNKVDMPGYTFDHQQYVDEFGTSINSDETTWNGYLNGAKRGVIWWYMKNATNLSLSKSNDKSSSGAKIGDTVSYTVSAKNGGSSKLYNLRIEDTLPNGMDKPSNVGITVNGGGAMSIKEGQSNANSSGEYYTWDASSRKLTVYINAAESNETKGISYTSKVLSGNDGDTKTNTAKLYAKNDGGNNPTANSSFKINGETKLSIEKTNDKSGSGAKVGDIVSYTVKPQNSGNLVLKTPFITDTLPEGMDKPTNIRANTSSDLGEGESNKNSYGEYYTWDQNSRTLKVYFSQTNGLGPNTTDTIYYKSKVLSGNDGDIKTNKVSLAGINDDGKHPEAESNFKINGETKLAITKENDKSTSGAKVGDIVSYTVKPQNSGNLVLKTPFITDTLPEGMDKPTNIRANTSSDLGEGESNKNSYGEYYTWDQNSRTLKVYFSQTNGLGPNTTDTIYYKSKVLSGNDGETKTNTVSLAGINDNGKHPEAHSSFKIKGKPKLEVSKTASPTTAKVGDSVKYTIIGKNTGNATLNDVMFTDVLPEGMSEPTDVTILGAVGDAYKLPKGTSNANQFGEFYEWDESSRTMTVIVSRKGQSTGIIANGTGNESQRKITYTSKVLNGQDGDQKTNTVTFLGSNGPTKPTAEATVSIKGEPKLEVSKTASPTTAKVGDSVKYTIIGKNTGNATLNDVVFTDVLPEGMSEPTDVTILGAVGDAYKLPKGTSNANQFGEFYEWDESSRTMTVIVSRKGQSTGIIANGTGNNSQRKITYTSKVLNGQDGDQKTNTVTFSGSNGPTKPTAKATVTIKGDPKLEVSKTASPTTAKIGDSVEYTIIGKNTGNATLNDVVFTDVLPEGMSEPTDVTILGAVGDAYKLPKGTSNANQFGEFYEWDESSRTMTVIVSRKGQSTGIIANGTGNNSQRKITYTSKVLNGQDGDQKTNTVTFSGSNGPTKPTAKATITVENKEIKLHIKQEIVNKNSQIVVPTVGSGSLQQVNIKDPSNVYENYGVTYPSYEADTNKDFKTVILVWDDTYQTYVPKVSIPEFYSYTGYVLTTNNTTHKSSDRVQKELPSVNYSSNKEYWLTVYIEPKTSNDGPPFYNWDYKVNEFGKIKF